MTPRSDDPIFSDLPGAPRPLATSQEKQRGDGSWFGFSRHGIRPAEDGSGPNQIVVLHKATCGDTLGGFVLHQRSGWDAIKRHRVHVTAYAPGGAEIATFRFQPYAVEDCGFRHAGIWCGAHVEVPEAWRRRGIAAAMYAHMKAFGYLLSPAPVLKEGGKKLWRGLDPQIVKVNERGELRVERPPGRPLPPDPRDEETLKALLNRFEPPRDIGWLLRRDHDRTCEELAKQAVYAALKNAAEKVYTKPKLAMSNILRDEGADDFAAQLRARPGSYGTLKEKPAILGLMWSPGQRGRLADLVNAAVPARQRFHAYLLEDRDRVRDRFDEMFQEWVMGRPPSARRA